MQRAARDEAWLMVVPDVSAWLASLEGGIEAAMAARDAEAALEASGVTYTYADVLAVVWDDYRDAGQEIEA